jgi:hypothetical protein
MKKLIFLALIALGSLSFGQTAEYVFSTVVTSTNDTLVSSWRNITNYSQIEYAAECDDSLKIYINVDYGIGNAPLSYDTYADSLVTTSDTGDRDAVILRGYGASGIVNLLPGANYIRYRVYAVDAGTAVSSTLRLGEIKK